MDLEAIETVDEIYPGTGVLVVAIRIHENGGRGHECGNHGKTKFVRRYYPKGQRNYGECARSVARFTLEYALLPPATRPEFFEYLASRYFSGPPKGNHAWARSVRQIHKMILNQKKGRA